VIVRVKQENRKVGGAGRFVDNELESLQIFRKDVADGTYKIWGSVVLGGRSLEETAPPPTN
jgi:hypothetical protein